MNNTEHGQMPLLVLVSGTPGSGKTTLARKLAQQMEIIHIERDIFFQSMSRTFGKTINRREVGVPVYYDCLVYLIRNGLSLITDGTLYRGVSEDTIVDRLKPISSLINIHCKSLNERERFYRREVERAGSAPDWLDGHMAKLSEIYADTVNPLELGCPMLEVDTTDGYDPSIDKIVAFLQRTKE